MIVHLEDESGSPACGTRKTDPDTTDEIGEVSCKRCLATYEPVPASEIRAKGESKKPKAARSEFLSYEQIVKMTAGGR